MSRSTNSNKRSGCSLDNSLSAKVTKYDPRNDEDVEMNDIEPTDYGLPHTQIPKPVRTGAQNVRNNNRNRNVQENKEKSEVTVNLREKQNESGRKIKAPSVKELKKQREEEAKQEILKEILEEGIEYSYSSWSEDQKIIEINRRLRIKIMTAKNKQIVGLEENNNSEKSESIVNDNNTNDEVTLETVLQNKKNDGIEQDTVANDLTLNDNARITYDLGQKYPRKVYEVILTSDCFSQFESIHSRLTELIRCLGIHSPLSFQPVIGENDKKLNKMKVQVENFMDFKKLLGRWPEDSFKCGVTAEPVPPKLVVNILNFEKNNNLEKKAKKISELETIYVLVNVERVLNSENEPTNKLKADARSIFDFVKCIKNGIYSDLTSKKHKITPYIIQCKVCKNCGSDNHKFCKLETRCIRCGSLSHVKENCRNEPRCVNCGDKHMCNSNSCLKLREKTYGINSNVISILEGEGLKTDKNTLIRKTHNFFEINENQQIDHDRNLEEVIKTLIQKELINDRARADELESKVNKKFSEIESKVDSSELKIKGLDAKVCSIDNKVLELDNKIKKLANITESNHKETLKNQDDALNKQTDNFEAIKALILGMNSSGSSTNSITNSITIKFCPNS
ncbi:unnamed protein product [Brachionus calyciflorus]|uniref:CCHC-type domain-containing protein n=1 Tax=Brachionus calyciflorus TaxID=104777 RepID=A0A813TR91_9BILA|nr:unnamed protein product [Brachionus calyciflorus]